VTGDTEGTLSARLAAEGTVPELAAEFRGTANDRPVTVTYRTVVADRGTTTVERPDEAETLEWYHELQEQSPVEAMTSEENGDAG